MVSLGDPTTKSGHPAEGLLQQEGSVLFEAACELFAQFVQ